MSSEQRADFLRLISWLQSARDRLMPNVTAIYGDAFDGDFDVMLEAINTFKRQAAALTQPKPAGDVGRELDSVENIQAFARAYKAEVFNASLTVHGIAAGLRALTDRTTSQPAAEGAIEWDKFPYSDAWCDGLAASLFECGMNNAAQQVREIKEFVHTATRQQQEAGRVDEDRVNKLREVNAAWSEAIGLTKMCLMQGDTAGAMAALNKASNEADEIFGAALNPGSLGGGHSVIDQAQGERGGEG